MRTTVLLIFIVITNYAFGGGFSLNSTTSLLSGSSIAYDEQNRLIICNDTLLLKMWFEDCEGTAMPVTISCYKDGTFIRDYFYNGMDKLALKLSATGLYQWYAGWVSIPSPDLSTSLAGCPGWELPALTNKEVEELLEISYPIRVSLTIFPNPVSDILKLESTCNEPGSITIYDLSTGALTLSRTFEQMDFLEVDISEFSKGYYLLVFNPLGGLGQEKLRFYKT